MKPEVKIRELIALALETQRKMAGTDGVSHAFVPSLHVNCDLLVLIHTCRKYNPDRIWMPKDHDYIYASYKVHKDHTVTLSAQID